MKKKTIIIIMFAIVVICLAVIGYCLIKYFYYGNGVSNYGNRLQDRNSYVLDNDISTQIEEKYKDTSSFNKVSVRVQGRIIYIHIDFKEALKAAVAQNLASKSLEVFTEEELSYYDLNYTLTADTLEEKSDLFPMMGYKNKNRERIVW